MEGNDKYSFQQNFLVTYDQIRGDYLNPDGTVTPNRTVRMNESLYRYQQVGRFLTINFNLQLNPPNAHCKRVVLKNINTSIFTAPGYLCELHSPYFRYPIQFLDSISPFVVYDEYVNKNLATQLIPVTLRVITGGIPSSQDAADLDDTYNATGFLKSDLVLNPAVSLTIVYEYY